MIGSNMILLTKREIPYNYVVTGKSAMAILYPCNTPECYEISQRDFLEFPKYIRKSC